MDINLIVLGFVIILGIIFYMIKSQGDVTKHNEEDDPISVADVLVAYGKKKEAIEYLENALEHGHGDKVREKLIEIRAK